MRVMIVAVVLGLLMGCGGRAVDELVESPSLAAFCVGPQGKIEVEGVSQPLHAVFSSYSTIGTAPMPPGATPNPDNTSTALMWLYFNPDHKGPGAPRIEVLVRAKVSHSYRHPGSLNLQNTGVLKGVQITIEKDGVGTSSTILSTEASAKVSGSITAQASDWSASLALWGVKLSLCLTCQDPWGPSPLRLYAPAAPRRPLP